MANVLDHVLVAILVTLAFIVAFYSLSPAKTKKWLLALVARLFGLRALLLVMPKQCGCDDCPAANHSTLAEDLKKAQSVNSRSNSR